MKKLILLCAVILSGCASVEGLDYKIVWDAKCRAFFNTTTMGIDFARRAVDADKQLVDGICVQKGK
jgi:hypothetical protein